MRYPIVVSILVLAVGAGLGWQQHQRLAAVRQTHRQLVDEAAGLGIAIDPAHPAAPPYLIKHERENRGVGVQLAATEFVDFARELDAFRSQGGNQLDAGMQQRLMVFIDRMMALNSAQFKALLAEVSANNDINNEVRQDLIGYSIVTLANEQPQAALARFSESYGLFTEARAAKVLASSLACWAKDDPLAALKWVRSQAGKFAGLITEDTKLGMISGAAVQYPKFAFKLIGELDLNDAGQAIQGVVDAAKTAPERTATLAGLRGYLATLTDETAREETANRAIHSLARGSMREGFESSMQWLDTARLTPAEFAVFADGLTPQPKSADNGQWVEWLGNAFPPYQTDEKVRAFVSAWTQSDCQAAGKWLGSAPDGATKNMAIRAYAEMVASYEPEVAAQWALTLPPGDDRDATLKQILANWPRNDPAAIEAASAFAKENGIEEPSSSGAPASAGQ